MPCSAFSCMPLRASSDRRVGGRETTPLPGCSENDRKVQKEFGCQSSW